MKMPISRWLNLGQIRVGTKVLMAIGAVSLAAGVVAGTGIWSLERLDTATARINEVATEARLGARMNQDIVELNRAEYRVAMDPGALASLRDGINQREAAFEDRLERAQARANAEQRADLESIQAAYASYKTRLDETLATAARHQDLTVTGGRAEILDAVKASRDSAVDLRAALAGYVNAADVRGDAAAEQAEATASSAQMWMLLIAGLGIGGGFGLGFLIARSGIVTPLRRCVAALKRLADGDLETEIYGAERKDEVGDIAEAMMVFRDKGAEAERLKREQAEKEAQAEAKQQRRMNELADRFEAEVGQVVQSVGSAGEQLNQSAQSMSSISEETSRQAQAVAAGSEQASTNVQTVASGCEELSSAITEISGQVSNSTEKARQARDLADEASTKVGQLAEAADKIGDVIELIEDIAEKTNLLALNATIEAARAGDAGKGFAVVAQEVKSLAQQTSKATSDISERIEKVQTETKEAVDAIEKISGGVKDIDEAAQAIAAAIEEQGTATGEIARNVQEASTGTQEVNSNISGVSQAATEAGSAAEQVLSACGELNQQSRTLNEKVDSFLAEVRTA